MEMFRCINCMKVIKEDGQTCPQCGFVPAEYTQPANALKINTILYGRYLVGRVLGQGGFGITYVGYDLKLELKVAIKEYFPMGMAVRNGVYSNQPQWSFTGTDRQNWANGLERFLREARKMAKLDSIPGIVRVRDSFQENGTAYIVMDFAEGITLKQYMKRYGRMSGPACVEMFLPLINSLAVMHEKGLVHRDISPANIMVEQTSAGSKVRLLDFGAAVDIGAVHSGMSQAVVTRGYSAPEQYGENGRIGSWTDVYALAAVMYNCVSETNLPEAPSRVSMPNSFSTEGIQDKNLGEVLRRAVALKVEDRIQTMESFKEALTQKQEDSEKTNDFVPDAGVDSKSITMLAAMWEGKPKWLFGFAKSFGKVSVDGGRLTYKRYFNSRTIMIPWLIVLAEWILVLVAAVILDGRQIGYGSYIMGDRVFYLDFDILGPLLMFVMGGTMVAAIFAPLILRIMNRRLPVEIYPPDQLSGLRTGNLFIGSILEIIKKNGQLFTFVPSFTLSSKPKKIVGFLSEKVIVENKSVVAGQYETAIEKKISQLEAKPQWYYHWIGTMVTVAGVAIEWLFSMLGGIVVIVFGMMLAGCSTNAQNKHASTIVGTGGFLVYMICSFFIF